MENKKIIEDIKQKYHNMEESAETYLKGLLHAKPINYWDYIQVDTLLSLQKPRTDFKDEEIFIMYHQVTELFQKMILHEIRQLIEKPQSPDAVWVEKLNRINRYTTLLINSFDVMKYGMDYDDYNEFRYTLTPASGFQSAQFRFIEIYCTRLENLIHPRSKPYLPSNPTLDDYFENIYWQAAGKDHATGKKSLTLRQFEEQYMATFKDLAQDVKGKTLEEQVLDALSISDERIKELRKFDHLYNVAWPMVHLETAQHYLDSKGENKAATGGSEWKKYLHPKYQQRKFFPSLWTKEELENWGDGTRY